MNKRIEKVESGGGMVQLVTLGFNKTGMDVGELDYSIACARCDDLRLEERLRFLNLLERVKKSLEAQWGMRKID